MVNKITGFSFCLKIKYILSIVFLSLFFSIPIAKAQDSCPAPGRAWYVGGGLNFYAPDPRGPYATQQEGLDAAVKASELQFPGYVYTQYGPQNNGYILSGYYYLTINGVLFHNSGYANDIGAIIEVTQSTVCPSGFNLNNRGTCVNQITNTCSCPSGQKYKDLTRQCVPVTPAPAVADPDDDNGPNCPQGDGEPSQPVCGNPINPGSGNKIQVENDYVDHGSIAMLSVTRVYNSSPMQKSKTTGLFGVNWTFEYDSRLEVGNPPPKFNCYIWQDDATEFCEHQSTSPVTNYDFLTGFKSDGKKFYFSRKQDDSSISPSGKLNDVISYSSWYNNDIRSAYTILSDTNQKQIYISSGALAYVTDVGGATRKITNFFNSNDSNVGRFPADSPVCNHVQPGPLMYGHRPLCVTDSWGRQLNFEYENVAENQVRITKIYDPAGQQYTYSYDGPSGGCITPEDSNPACVANNLTSIIYPDGHTRIYHYNEASQINNGNDCSQFLSVGNGFGGLLNNLTGITDENGVRFSTWTYDCNGRATSSQHSGGAEKVKVAYSNIAANGTSTSTVTHYTGDPSSPTATTRNYTYQLLNGTPLITLIDSPCIDCNNVAKRSYDANGNTIAFTDWNGNRTTFAFDLSRNLQTKRVEAVGTAQERTINTIWHPTFRLPIQISRPKLLTTFTYDASGNLLSRTLQGTADLSGNSAFSANKIGPAVTWTYSYNSFGQVITMIGPRTEVADITQFSYDGSGNLATVTNALNQVTTLSNYDANRNVGKITEPNGLITTMSYTPRGWLSSRTITAGGISQTSTYSYDGVGQLTRLIQPDGNTISYIYDDAHRLIAISDMKGNRIVYRYDAMSNRMSESVVDPQNVLLRQIERSYDIVNRLYQVTGGVL